MILWWATHRIKIKIKILGRENERRKFKYIKKKYINNVANMNKYKVFIPSANGSKELGFTGESIVCAPNVGATETFLSIGAFESQEEADNVKKYISCRFSRALFGILKITQHITPDTWRYVPLQDFTSKSDIDWSVSVAEIDRQL